MLTIQFHIQSGKLYLSPILDLHNGEIVSFNISKSPKYDLISDMLNIAFIKHTDLDGLIFHTDQGWQYQMFQFKEILFIKGTVQSMSREGSCLDNSPMESFFARLKNEMFY